MQYTEENNYPKAFAISTGLMILFLVVSFFYLIGTPFTPDQIGTGGVIVNFGTSEEGMGDDYMSIEEPSVSENANNTPPDKVLPDNQQQTPTSQSSDKTVLTQDAEDAPEIVTRDKSSENPSTSKATENSKPTVNQNALYKGKRNDGTGKGDGTTGTPGNQGDKDGDPLAPNYGSGGSGFGNVNLSLASRRFISLPRIEDDGQSTGKIAVQIRVDKLGKVVYARAGVKGTTLNHPGLWRKCEQAVMGARLNQLESAPDEQSGTVVFNFKVR